MAEELQGDRRGSPGSSGGTPLAGLLGRRWWTALLAGVAAVVLGVLAWFGSGYVERTARQRYVEELETLLDASVAGASLWLDRQKSQVAGLVADPRVQTAVDGLRRARREGSTAEGLRASGHAGTLRGVLAPVTHGAGAAGYLVFDDEGVVVASSVDGRVGMPALHEDLRRQLLAAPGPVVVPAFLRDGDGEAHTLVAAPLSGVAGSAGVFVLMFDPGHEFSAILWAARIGETGETYAFDRGGRLVSESRFVDDLRNMGLLDDGQTSAVARIALRDPGGDLRTGYRPDGPRADLPLTRTVQGALELGHGHDVEGYRDYRGVQVIGAWRWLPDYGIGVATEVDATEAYALSRRLRAAFWGLFAVAALAFVGVVVITAKAGALHRRASSAERKVAQLGQYRLTKKLGEGGMGAVYEAEHALLRRPAAVKVMKAGVGGESALVRFEREVQATAGLTHVNTVEIYDYGRTAGGDFYYVMERLRGWDLEQLVEETGPLPAGRVIHLLVQAAGALHEAHEAGLVHRDVKPSNLFLCERGGVYDVMKVLDFGLVKDDRGTLDDRRLTALGSLVGTPMYMAPESVVDVDATTARSDIYALAATAYFALTGHDAFGHLSTVKAVIAAVVADDPPPIQSHGVDVPDDLARVVERALAKDPADRQASCRALLEELVACEAAGTWSPADAERWWHEQGALDEGEALADGEVLRVAGLERRSVRPS